MRQARGAVTWSRAGGSSLLGALVLTCLAAPVAPAHAADPAPWWYEVMSVADAHRDVTGEGVTIALFDGRIDPSAPGLSGADIRVQDDCFGDPAPRLDVARDDHGTSMAGLLVGQDAPTSGGVVGMAPDATVLFYPQDTREGAAGEDVFMECTAWETAAQVDAAVEAGADIVLFTTSGASAPPQEEAIERAIDQGVAVVAGAGNRTDIRWPAAQPGVVATYAVDRRADPWAGNAYIPDGKAQERFPAISAPGVQLPALRYVPGAGWDPQFPSTGTSGAAPLVAGSLALVKEKYPEASGNQLVQHLIHLTGGTREYGWDADYGFGIVSVEEMLADDPSGWPDDNPLLDGPRRAVADYPMSALGEGGAGQDATEVAGEETDEDSAAAPAADSASDSGSGEADGSLPWLLGGGAVLLVLAGAGWALRRRSGGDMTTSVERV